MANQSAAGFAAAWGDDYYGQLGASSCCSAHPSPVRGPDGVISADGGDQLTVAARSDGTVWEWGKVRRTPGCGYTCPPTRVPGLTGVVQVAAGTLDQELALGADGTVWAWMSSHQPDARPGSRLPVRVAGLDHVVQVAAATWYCVALEADGTVWEWPSSASAAVAGAPRQEPGLARINFIAAGGNHSLALDANGAVWSWEYTTTPGAVMDRWTNPVRVRGANGSQFAGVVAVATGGMFDLAVKRDGTVWTWGSNCYGQLANGASGGNQPVDTPARVSSLTGVVSVAAKSEHALALASDGTVWGWGHNDAGQVGSGRISFNGCYCVDTPVHVVGLQGVLAVAAGTRHSVAITRAALPAPPRPGLRACSPGPALTTGRKGLPQTIHLGPRAISLVVGERSGHVFLLTGGQYDSARGIYGCLGTVTTLDARTGAVLRTVEVGANPTSILMADRANRVFVTNWGDRDNTLQGSVSVLDARSGTVVATTHVDRWPDLSVVAERTGRVFVPGVQLGDDPREGKAYVLDAGTGTLIGTIPPAGNTWLVDARLGRVFVESDRAINVLDAGSGKRLSVISPLDWCVGNLSLDEQTDRLFTALPSNGHNGQGSFCVIDAKTGAIVRRVIYDPNAGADFALVDARVERVLVQEQAFDLAPRFHPVEVRSARDGTLVRHLSVQLSSPVVEQSTGRIYFISGRDTVSVLDPNGWRVVRRVRVPGAVRLVLAERARRLFVSTAQGMLVVLCADAPCR